MLSILSSYVSLLFNQSNHLLYSIVLYSSLYPRSPPLELISFPMSSNDPLPDPHLKTGGENLVSKHAVEAEAVERISNDALNETKLLKIRRHYEIKSN